eukprot:CAMPEP_0115890820 /NCGR_PEP_ID=MMETSP0287-20121206/33546_1 /TAXON_ID=412157 /ORGANISM="Chrysochromulina rotalis, Strain UIO044" /LENGTH=34 /DNA_ID= /DNA_START= /DNA_END= /DNA_ORIENTATION=
MQSARGAVLAAWAAVCGRGTWYADDIASDMDSTD